MKGTIENYQGNRGCMWITGESGEVFFSHTEEFTNASHIAKGNIVEFDIREDEGKPNRRAVNVRKIGFGPQHPMIRDIERVKNFILDNVPYSEEMEYRLRDLEKIQNYFKVAEDYEVTKDTSRFDSKKMEAEE